MHDRRERGRQVFLFFVDKSVQQDPLGTGLLENSYQFLRRVVKHVQECLPSFCEFIQVYQYHALHQKVFQNFLSLYEGGYLSNRT